MKKYLAPVLLSAFFLLAVGAHATDTGGTGPGDTGGSGSSGASTQLENPFGGAGSSLPDLFASIIDNIILPLGAVIAVVSFIWAGFMFVTAQGDEGKLKTAKTALLYTAIGTLVLLGASAIAGVLSTTINQLKS